MTKQTAVNYLSMLMDTVIVTGGATPDAFTTELTKVGRSIVNRVHVYTIRLLGEKAWWNDGNFHGVHSAHVSNFLFYNMITKWGYQVDVLDDYTIQIR